MKKKKISADFEIGIYDSLTEDLKFHFGQMSACCVLWDCVLSTIGNRFFHLDLLC